MKLLLDTHVLLWWLAEAEELPDDLRRLIADLLGRIASAEKQ